MTPLALVVPASCAMTEGAAQAVAESEWNNAVAFCEVPLISPESAGSLLAAGALEASCQFPVSATVAVLVREPL